MRIHRYKLLSTFLGLSLGLTLDISAASKPGHTEIQQKDIPLVITEPGLYLATETLRGVPGNHGIEVQSDHVTIDLNGFLLKGFANTLSGIFAANSFDQITIRNGIIADWTDNGIRLSGSEDVSLSDLRVSNCLRAGIEVGISSTISDCLVMSIGGGDNPNQWHCIATDIMPAIEHCITSYSLFPGHGIDTSHGAAIYGCVAYNNGHDGMNLLNIPSVHSSTALGNHREGIQSAAQGATISECAMILNEDGIRTKIQDFDSELRGDCSVRRCTAAFNSKDGFSLESFGTRIIHSTAYMNEDDGINLFNYSFASGNLASESDPPPFNGSRGGGIRVDLNSTIGGCRLEDNHATRNADNVQVSGNNSLIVGNSAASPYNNNYGMASGNNLGTIQNNVPGAGARHNFQ